MFVGGDGGIIHTTCWMWYIPLEEAQIGGVSRDVINYMVSWSLGGVPRVCATASACLPACIFTACSIQTLSLLCCRSQDSVVHRNGHNNLAYLDPETGSVSLDAEIGSDIYQAVFIRYSSVFFFFLL
jgi:hypothetical protein